MKSRKILSLLTGLFLFLSLAAAAAGAGFPSKEITYMIAFNPGGESDIEFRIMQPFLAWNFLAAATPDGYTIGGFNAPHIITQPLTMSDVTYKPDGFTYLAMIENTPVALCARLNFTSRSPLSTGAGHISSPVSGSLTV